jgi:hypothetical protein
MSKYDMTETEREVSSRFDRAEIAFETIQEYWNNADRTGWTREDYDRKYAAEMQPVIDDYYRAVDAYKATFPPVLREYATCPRCVSNTH